MKHDDCKRSRRCKQFFNNYYLWIYDSVIYTLYFTLCSDAATCIYALLALGDLNILNESEHLLLSFHCRHGYSLLKIALNGEAI